MVFGALIERLRLMRHAKTYYEKAQELRRLQNHFQLETRDAVRPDDVVVVGFPKSGNTWFQNIVAATVYGMDLNNTPLDVVGIITPDISKPFYHRYTNQRMYFKSHLSPQKAYRKVVYLVRDGRDVLVSYYHYAKAKNEPLSWQELLDNGVHYYGKWQDHVAAWQDNPYGAEMITIRYEDLLNNMIPELQRFCNFVGIERDEDALRAVQETTSFKSMKSREDKFGFQQFQTGQNFMRKGKKGSFQDELPPEIIAAFQEQAGEWLERFNYPLVDV